MTPAVLFLAVAIGAPASPSARDYVAKTLSNGLEVLVVEDHALPLVTVEIGVRNGAMTEPPELNGLSHLYEHMFFKGNKALPDQEAFLRRSRDLGMVFNGSTETERVNYYFTTTASELRSSLGVMRDAIESPLFDPEELEREKKVVIEEIDRDDATPFSHFGRALDRAMWKYPSFKDPLGNRATVGAATVEQMRLIQSRYYVPNNSALVIAGDVEASAAFAWVEELFAAWPRAADPFVAHPVVVEPPLSRSVVVVVEQPVQTVDLGFEWQGPSARPGSSPELVAERRLTYAADVLSLIAGQPGSRFQRDLVESGACLRADLSWLTQAHVGPVSFGLEATPEHTDDCVRAALAELELLASAKGFTDKELHDAKVELEVHKALDREATSQFAHLLSFFWSSPGLAYYDGYLQGMRAVTRADIQRFLRRYVVGGSGAPVPPYVFGALLSPELRASHGFDTAHFEALLGLKGHRPEPAAAHPTDPPPRTEGNVTELSVHGLRVIVKSLPRQPVTSCELYLRGGARNWTESNAGIEKLALNVALAGGTQTLSKAAFQAKLAELGVQLAGESSEDDAMVGFKSLDRTFAASFELLGDALLHPLLPEAEIELQRSLLLSELAQEEDDPDAAILKLSHAQLYAGLPYAARASGTHESLTSLHRADLAGHLERLRQTSRMLLVVVGNVTPQQIGALVQRVFASLPVGAYQETPFQPPRFDAPAVKVVARDLPTNYVVGAFPAPTFGSPDLAAGVVAMSALHDKLFEEVRTKRQLSYAPSAGLLPHGLGEGYLYVSAVDAKLTLSAMREALVGYQSAPLAAEQLEGSKRVFLTGFLTQEESTSSQAELLARAQLVGGDWRLARDLPRQVAEVTPAQVQTFLSQHARNLQTVVLGPAKELPPAPFEGSSP